MIDFCIDKSILGSNKHLLCYSDGFIWSDDNADMYTITGHPDFSEKNLDSALMLTSSSFSISVPEKWSKSMSALTTGSLNNIPWSKIIPQKEYKHFIKSIVSEVNEVITEKTINYYSDIWTTSGIILKSLKPAKINLSLLENYSAEGTQIEILNSFRPNSDGFSNPVTYNRNHTRSGRLIIETGPHILNLNKRYRNIMTSRYGEDGTIINIDFSALEARIALYEANHRCNELDVYSYISKTEFNGEISREKIKLAVISQMYGSSKKKLIELLEFDEKKADHFINKIRSLFGLDELLKRVKMTYIKLGHIENKWGRAIAIDEPSNHIFINSYIQSTGVDVSLVGFSNLLKKLPESAVPLFVLHDGLFLDIKKDDLNKLDSVLYVNVPGYVQKFPLKVCTL